MKNYLSEEINKERFRLGETKNKVPPSPEENATERVPSGSVTFREAFWVWVKVALKQFRRTCRSDSGHAPIFGGRKTVDK